MNQLHNNLNKNYGISAIEIKGNNFFDIDNILDKFYKRPEAGSVTQTNIFSINRDKTGVLRLQDDTEAKVCIKT